MNIQLSDHFNYKKLFLFTLPSVVMMVFTSVYCVVDGFFVSNFAGKTAFAAINLIMPFIMILGGIGFMIGTGGSALVSYTLGTGDKEKANRYFSMMVYFTILAGILLTVLGIIFVRPMAELFGADESMMDTCVLYGRIVIAFNAAFMLQNIFQSFFVVAEKPRLGLIVTITAGVTNMVLDALFVGVFKWGIVGAALATGISQSIGGLLPLLYFALPNNSPLQLTRTGFELAPLLKASSNGCSELMSNVASSLIGIVYNYQLMRLGGENAVATYGVLMYIQFVFIAIFIGYSVGSAPIIGYHYGAGNFKELQNMRHKSLKIMSISGVLMAILGFTLAPVISAIFVGYDAKLLSMTITAFRIFSFCFVLAGINIFTSSFFTALGNGPISAAVSFLRVLVFQLSSVLILPILFGLNGIWLANIVAEIFAVIVSISFLIAKRKKYHY